MKRDFSSRDVEVVLDDNCYTAKVYFMFYKENYGADADGNRGEMREYFEVEDITEFKKNGKPIAEKDVPKEVIEQFENAEPDNQTTT